jgi:magnesium-transporting ATPase (P-type)
MAFYCVSVHCISCSHLRNPTLCLLQNPVLLSILFGHIFSFTPKSIAMNTQRFLVSGIVGGIVSFFGGYLIYGVVLTDFFAKNAGTATGVMKEMDTMVWWALILGNIFWGLAYSYIFNKWANITSLGAGLSAGFVIGLLCTAGIDLIMFATSNISNLTGTIADIVCGAVLGAIVGAAVGLMNGMGKKATT